MKLCVTLLLISVSFLIHAQMPEKSRHRFDSLYAIASNPDFASEDRLLNYVQASFAVYKDLDYGMEICQAYLELAHKEKHPGHEAVALSRIGYVWMVWGKVDAARACHKEGLQIAIDAGNKLRESEALADLGNLYQHEGKLDSSLWYHKQSLNITLREGFPVFEAREKLNIGSVYKEQGKYKESLKSLEEALLICEKKKIVGYYASVYIELGEVYMLIEEFDTAEKYFKKALKAAEGLYNHAKRIQAISKLAELSLSRKNTTKALEYYKKAEELANLEQQMLPLISVKQGMAEVYLETKDYAEALKAVEESIKLIEDLDLWQNADRSYALSGEILFAMKQYVRSKNRLETAYEHSKQMGHTEVLRKACHLLYMVHRKLNNAETSLGYYEEYNALKSIQQDEKMVKMVLKSELKRDYAEQAYQDSITQAKELELIAIRHQRKQDQQANKTFLVFGALIVTGLGLLLVAYFWRNKSRHNRRLKEKNDEIEQALKDKNILLKEVNHRVKNNMQVASSLLQLRAKNTDNMAAKQMLQESQLRLQSMQIAHQKMNDSGDFEHVDLANYLDELVSALKISLLPTDCEVTINGEKVFVNVEQIQAVGFIFHELITNSVKYAWKRGGHKEIQIRFHVQDEMVELNYFDNGEGMPKNFRFDKVQSFGMKLIHSMVSRQLIGTIHYEESEGVHFKIRFKPR